jgi:integrase
VQSHGIRIVLIDDIRADREELCRVIEQGFAEIDPCGVEVRVERATRSWDSFTGHAYPEPPRRPRTHPATRYLVRLRLPGALRNRGYPKSYRYPRRKTAPSITVHDWRERLLALVAHEAFHVRQFREGLRRSEVSAERWADSVLRAWRCRVDRSWC